MRSSFFGFNVATQGLYTARTALDITNHNISNAETVGYSRQYGVQKATRPLANLNRGMVGTGSTIDMIKQHRNEYLDYKYWDMNKDLGTYTAKAEALNQMERVFNEPSDSGFTAYFDEVFKALQGLSKNPSDDASKVNVLTAYESFGQYLTDISSQFRDIQSEANFGVKTTVDQINFMSEQVATLNQQIGNLELTGNRANDLRDQRMLLIDELSGLVGVQVRFNEDVNGKETLRISINGQEIVNGPTASYLEVRARDDFNNPEDNVDLYDVYFKSGKRLSTDSPNLTGKLKGYLDIRDGNNNDAFDATVTGVSGNNLILNPVSRHDIPGSGSIKIDGVERSYSGYTYDDATGEMTLTLDTPYTPVNNSVSIGDDKAFKGVPHYMNQLNVFVRTIAQEFNALQQSGNDGSGVPLFVYEGYTGTPPLDLTNPSSYDALTVDNFKVNPDLMDNPDLLMTKYKTSDGESANDLILDIIDLRHDTTMFQKGVPDNFMQGLISELGIDTKQVGSFKTGQEQLIHMVTNQRLSVSDVDLDEEATNLIRFQQAYNMSAQVMSVFDEIYDVTINQMGV